jgi:alcohol dehydrogenase class IV
MDAFTQAIESYISKSRNHLSDYFAQKAIELLYFNLPKAFNNGEDIKSRENLLFGSFLSALSFSNAKLGAVHGLAHPIGALFGVPHGLICGILLPHVMDFNLKGNLLHVINRFAWIGKSIHAGIEIQKKDNNSLALFTIRAIKELLENLSIPLRLSKLGIKREDVKRIVKDTKGSSLNNNPRETNEHLLTEILNKAL